jgi:sterol desaturase/sphingolipid hydroxylase (fatty acid hydroxylase superfamily)
MWDFGWSWPPLVDLALALVFLGLMFAPLEWAWRARPHGWRRPELGLDLAFLAMQYLLVAPLLVGLNGLLRAWIAVPAPDWPVALRLLAALVVGDLGLYGGHRLSHALPCLWRFHAVHHSARALDWVAAHREHPVDGVWTQLSLYVPMLLLGLDLAVVLPVLVFRGLWAIFLHSNVSIPLGPLGLLLGDPRLHRLHHARDGQGDCNYGNLAPWVDLLFGTHRAPADEAYPLGVAGAPPRGLLGHLLHPFSRRP